MATAIFTMKVGAGRFPFLPVVIFISIGGKIVRYSGLFPVAVFPEQATTIIVAPIIIITVIVTALCSVVLRSVVAVIALFPRIVVNSNANPWIRLVLGSRKDSRKSKEQTSLWSITITCSILFHYIGGFLLSDRQTDTRV